MAFTAVPYVEMDESFGLSEGADSSGGWVKKPYGVAWANRFQFVRDVMGYSSVAGGVGSSWNRKYPLAYPEDTKLFAQSVEVKPWGKRYSTTPISYDQAIVTVDFRAPNWSYSTADDPLYLNSFSQDATENNALTNCTQSLDYGVEFLPLPGTKAVYTDNSPVTDTVLSRRVTVARLTLNWNDLPYMPLAKIFTYVDVVNNGTFLGRPRGTVMLEGCKTNRRRMADGTNVQDLTLSLKTRKNDWNEFLLPDGTWDYVYLGQSGGLPDTTKTLYPYTDFSGLLFIGSSS